MAQKRKLSTALDAHHGRDYGRERQKKHEKQVRNKKRKRDESQEGATELDSLSEAKSKLKNASGNSSIEATDPVNGVGSLSGNSDTERFHLEEEVEDAGQGEADIPLSDIDSLPSSEKEDIVPFQRLTINNVAALSAAQQSIALPASLPFSAHQTLTMPTSIEVPDVDDDLSRELAFYKLCLGGADRGRRLLKDEGAAFSRPDDYFAEMVKSDEHMGKIKQKMFDDAAGKKASSDAKRQRDLKKFGKQVQVAKLQERAKAKRATLDKIDLLKKRRKSTGIEATNEDEQFDVTLDDSNTRPRGKDTIRPSAARSNKRLTKDAKFGFGGKKRFSKSGDALSSGDVSGYSARRMKKGKPKRPGKSRRAQKI